MAGIDIESKLQQFAEFISLPNDFVKEASAAAQEIFGVLQTKSSFSVHRCRIVGGFGKKTSTSVKADLDTVIFLNIPVQDKETKLPMVLKEWHQLLVDHLHIPETSLKLTNKTLKVAGYKEIHLDLLPAVNLSKDPQQVEESQRKETLKYIEKSKDPFKVAMVMSAELSESSLTFMKGQSKFVHDMARLAKFWNQGFIYKDYIAGRSVLIETIAVYAATVAENNNNPSYKNCFQRFLIIIMGLGQHDIKFLTNYTESEIPEAIKSQRPLVLDPTNPYNNLLDMSPGKLVYYGGVQPNKDFFSSLKQAGGITLQWLESEHMSRMFFPCIERSEIMLSFTRFLNSGPHQDEKCLMPKLINRKGTRYEKRLESCIYSFASFVRSAEFDEKMLSGDCDGRALKIRNRVAYDLINPCIFGSDDKWVSTTDAHESRYATGYLTLTGGAGFIKLSFDFQEIAMNS